MHSRRDIYHLSPAIYELAFSISPLAFWRNKTHGAVQRVLDSTSLDRASCVEIGCGTGRLAAALARRYPRARWEAIDRSSEMIRFAARHWKHRNLRFSKRDFWEMGGRYDLALSVNSWLFFPLGDSTARLAGMLAEGGRCVITTYREAPFSRLHSRVLEAVGGMRIHLHPPEALAAALEQQGILSQWKMIDALEGSYILYGQHDGWPSSAGDRTHGTGSGRPDRLVREGGPRGSP